MTVKFHVLQRDEESGETRHQLLFSQEWGFIRVAQQVKYAGTILQVDDLEWMDEVAGVLKAVCLEVKPC